MVHRSRIKGEFLFETREEVSEDELKHLIEGASNEISMLDNLLANQSELTYAELALLHAKTKECKQSL